MWPLLEYVFNRGRKVHPNSKTRCKKMLELTIKLIIFLFPLAYSPGPGNMFFAANGARFGFSSTLTANLGYHLATWIVTATIGLGFGTLLQFIPYFFEVIRYAGAAYVFYLSWLLFRAGALDLDVDAKPAGFWDGVIILVLNPKAYLIIAVLSSQFLSGEHTNYFWLVLFVATIFTLNNFVAFSIWALVGDRLMRIFKTDHSATVINRFFGIVLAAVALWMLLS